MKRVWLYGASVLALAVVIGATATAVSLGGGGGGDDDGGQVARQDPVADAPAANPDEAADDGTVEGIDVHGKWEIEVRNADGSLDDRYVFENALTVPGEVFLVSILSRNVGSPSWAILLQSSTETGPCDTDHGDAVNVSCVIRESPAPGNLNWPNSTNHDTLVLEPASFSDAAVDQTLKLTGTAIAASDGDIDIVDSLMCVSQPPSFDPLLCNNTQSFTTRTLPAPVSLSAGQQIFVTVSITFS